MITHVREIQRGNKNEHNCKVKEARNTLTKLKGKERKFYCHTLLEKVVRFQKTKVLTYILKGVIIQSDYNSHI